MINHKIEEIKARAQREIEKAEKECAILGLLPIQPDLVVIHELYGTAATVRYKAASKGEALKIAQQFSLLPAFICRSGTVAIKPYDDEKAKSVHEIFAWVDIDQYGAGLRFYAPIGDDILRVQIEMPVHLFGGYRKSNSAAKIHFTMDWCPLHKTSEMYQAVKYSRTYSEGPQSGHNIIYAVFDRDELANQFGEA